jgi:D-beta-D-heptose 7-phosphate kinase/D-beta-D-heptose 1-phosphate adenosyltransferase
MTISANRVQELLDAFGRQRILVVGDLMWDRYIYGRVSRISPEAPVPVVEVTREIHMPGGASNVAWNVQALGGRSAACGILGRDEAAGELKAFFGEKGIECEAALEFDDARTTVKTRIVAESQQVVRVDWDNLANFSDPVVERFCGCVAEEVARSTGVIIEDYGKGVVRQEVVDTVLRAAREKGIPVGFDPKDNSVLNVAGVTVATPNRKEAYAAVGRQDRMGHENPLEDASLLKVGAELLEKWKPKQLLLTLGAQGMLLLEPGMEPRHVPTRAREVYDVSGAGDTVIAACTLALASGAGFVEAAEVANHAAGVVVGHVGTATCTPRELLESIDW